MFSVGHGTTRLRWHQIKGKENHGHYCVCTVTHAIPGVSRIERLPSDSSLNAIKTYHRESTSCQICGEKSLLLFNVEMFIK